MTADIEPTEVYPWESEAPFVPTPSTSIVVVAATPLRSFDFPNTSRVESRIVGVDIGGVTLHLGLDDRDRDAEIVRVATRLLEALDDLRTAAMQRIEAAS